MEMIGYLPHNQSWVTGMRLHLAWLPGGKQLRFAFKEKIYTVPVD
jgi:hypothetical protein